MKIEKNAFNDCNSLKNITIPNSVTEIEKGAFRACDMLQDVTMSENIKKIGDYGFGNCSNLKHLKVPKSLTEIGYYMISGGILDFTNGVSSELISDPENCEEEIKSGWGADYVYIGDIKYQKQESGYSYWYESWWEKME